MSGNMFYYFFNNVSTKYIEKLGIDTLRNVVFDKWFFNSLVPDDVSKLFLQVKSPDKRSYKNLRELKKRNLKYILDISSLTIPSKPVEKLDDISDFRELKPINFLLPPFINSLYHELFKNLPEEYKNINYLNSYEKELVNRRFLQRILDPSYQYKEKDSSFILKNLLNVNEEENRNLKENLDQILQSSYLLRFSLLPESIKQTVYKNPYFPYFISKQDQELYSLINKYLDKKEDLTDEEVEEISREFYRVAERLKKENERQVRLLFLESEENRKRIRSSAFRNSVFTKEILNSLYKTVDDTLERLTNIKLTERQHLLRRFLDGDIEPYLITILDEPEILEKIKGKHHKYVKYVLMMYEGLTVDPRIIYRLQKDESLKQKIKERIKSELENDLTIADSIGSILLYIRNHLEKLENRIHASRGSFLYALKVPAKKVNYYSFYLMGLSLMTPAIDRMYQIIYETFRSYMSDEISEKWYKNVRRISQRIDNYIRKNEFQNGSRIFDNIKFKLNFFTSTKTLGNYQYLYDMLSLFSDDFETARYSNPDPYVTNPYGTFRVDFTRHKKRVTPLFNEVYERNRLLQTWFIKYKDEKGGEYILPKEERLFFVDPDVLGRTFEFKLFDRVLDKLLVTVDTRKILPKKENSHRILDFFHEKKILSRIDIDSSSYNILSLNHYLSSSIFDVGRIEFFIPETVFHFLYNYFRPKEIDRKRMILQLASINHPEIKKILSRKTEDPVVKTLLENGSVKISGDTVQVVDNIEQLDSEKDEIYLEHDSIEYLLASQKLSLKELDSMLNRVTSSFSFEKLTAIPPSVLTNIEWNSIPNSAAVEDVYLLYRHILEQRKKLSLIYIEPEAYIFRNSRGEIIDPFTAKFNRNRDIKEQIFIRIYVRRDYIDTKYELYDNSISESYLINLKDLQQILDRDSYHELVTRPLSLVKLYQNILYLLLKNEPEQHLTDLQKFLEKSTVFIASLNDLDIDIEKFKRSVEEFGELNISNSSLDELNRGRYDHEYIVDILSQIKSSIEKKSSQEDILLNINDTLTYKRDDIELPEEIEKILKQTDILVNIDPIINITAKNDVIYEYLTDFGDMSKTFKKIMPAFNSNIEPIPDSRYSRLISREHRSFFQNRDNYFSEKERIDSYRRAKEDIQEDELEVKKHHVFRNIITFRSNKYNYETLTLNLRQWSIDRDSLKEIDLIRNAFKRSAESLIGFKVKAESVFKNSFKLDIRNPIVLKKFKNITELISQYTPEHVNYDSQILEHSYRTLKRYIHKGFIDKRKSSLSTTTIFDSIYQSLKLFNSDYLKDPKLVDSEKYIYRLDLSLTKMSEASRENDFLLKLGEERDRSFFLDAIADVKAYSINRKEEISLLKNFPDPDRVVFYRNLNRRRFFKKDGKSYVEHYILNNLPYSKVGSFTGSYSRLFTTGEFSLLESETLPTINSEIFFRDIMLPFYTYNLFIDRERQSDYIHLTGTSMNKRLISDFFYFAKKLESATESIREFESKTGEKFYRKELIENTLLKSNMNIFTFLLDSEQFKKNLKFPSITVVDRSDEFIEQFRNFIPKDSSLFISKQLLNLEERGIKNGVYDITHFIQKYDSIIKDPIAFFKTDFPETITDFRDIKNTVSQRYKFDILNYTRHLRQARYNYDNILNILMNSENPSILTSESFYRLTIKLGRLKEFKQVLSIYMDYVDPLLLQRLEKVYGIATIIDRFVRQSVKEYDIDIDSIDYISRRKLVKDTLKNHRTVIKHLIKRFLQELQKRKELEQNVEKRYENSTIETVLSNS